MTFFGKLINKFLKVTNRNKNEERIEKIKEKLIDNVLKSQKKEEKPIDVEEIELEPKPKRKPRKRVTKDEN